LIFDGSLIDNVVMGRKNITFDDLQWALRSLNMQDIIAELPDGLSTQMIAEVSVFLKALSPKYQWPDA
jgi:ABC-type multidrug transport system fused ATPase/permease subunit